MEEDGYFSVLIWILNIRCLVEMLRDLGFYVQASIEEANCYFLTIAYPWILSNLVMSYFEDGFFFPPFRVGFSFVDDKLRV